MQIVGKFPVFHQFLTTNTPITFDLKSWDFDVIHFFAQFEELYHVVQVFFDFEDPPKIINFSGLAILPENAKLWALFPTTSAQYEKTRENFHVVRVVVSRTDEIEKSG